MKKRIADIVTEFSVEGLAEVQRALRHLRDQVRRSGAKSDTLGRNVDRVAPSASAAARGVGGLDDALVSAGRSAAGVSSAVDAVTPSLNRSTTGVAGLVDGLRRAEKAAAGLMTGLGAPAQVAGLDEVLRYTKDLKAANADLDRLKAAREEAEPTARPTYDRAIDQARERIRALEERIRTGASEDAVRDAADARQKAAEQERRDLEAAAKERERIEREAERSDAVRRAEAYRDRDAALAADIEAERRRWASVQKLRRVADERAKVSQDRDRWYWMRLRRDLEAVDRAANDVSKGVRAIHVPPSLKGVDAVNALRRAQEDAAFATQMHAQRRRELAGVELNGMRAGGIGSLDSVDLDNVRRFAAEIGKADGAGGRLATTMRQVSVQGAGAVRNISSLGQGSDGASRGIGGITRSVLGATRAFRGLSRTSSQTLSAIGRTAGGVGKSITSAFAGVGKTIAGAIFNDNTIEYGPYIAAAAAAYTFSPLLGLAGGGAAALAGVITIKDVQLLRQASEAMNLPPDVVQQWQYLGDSVGVGADKTLGAMHALSVAMQGIASGDEKFDGIKDAFDKIGFDFVDTQGRFKSVSAVMSDLARKTRELNTEQRNFLFTELFGEGDALELSNLFRKIGDDYDNLNAKFEQRRSKGLLISEEEIARVEAFQVKWNDLIWTLKSFARELFLAFSDGFETYIQGFERILSAPALRGDLIERFFVQPFERATKFAKDMMLVFAGFDFDGMVLGQATEVSPENMWLHTFKKVAIDLWHVLTGLWQIILGIGEMLVGAFRQVDGFGQSLGAMGIEQWLATTAAVDFRAFAGDLRKTLASAFGSALDPSGMETPLGEFVAAQLEKLKSAVTSVMVPTMSYISESWNQAMGALNGTTSLEGVETVLGEIIYLAGLLVEFLPELSSAFTDVFVRGMPAPEGFEWMGHIAQVAGELKTIFGELATVLPPIFGPLNDVSEALTGVSAATALIVGVSGMKLLGFFKDFASIFAIGTGVLAGGAAAGLGASLAAIAAPFAAGAAAVAAMAGGLYLLYSLVTDFTGTIKTLVGLIESAYDKISTVFGYLLSDPEADQSAVRNQMDADLDRHQASRQVANPSRALEMLPPSIQQQDAKIQQQIVQAQEAATTAETAVTEAQNAVMQTGTATVEAGTVQLVTDKTPVTINLPGGPVTGLYDQPDVDQMLRARANRIGG